MSSFQLRNMNSADRDEVARLIFHSTNEYYRSIGRERIFQRAELSPRVIFDVYQRLDPNEGIVAVDNGSGQIIGSCFVHPRETHVSLGIMNAHPDHFGKGVPRAILARIIEDAQAAGKPVRLVSSCFNLDSYSLYTRAGFVPFDTFQDMYLQVPDTGLAHEPPKDVSVREAKADDVPAMVKVEREVSGITREKDYAYFVSNEHPYWHVSVVEAKDGLAGFLVSCKSEALVMLGPGVARTEEQAAALMHTELNHLRGQMPVFLVPASAGKLVRQLYAWGSRNCEMHVAQSHGPAQPRRGITIPTFLPETG